MQKPREYCCGNIVTRMKQTLKYQFQCTMSTEKNVEIGDEIVINKRRYVIQKELGSGAFGHVFRISSVTTKRMYAMKSEQGNISPSQLRIEKKVLERMRGVKGFPELIAYLETQTERFLVMELYGPNLEDLFYYCHRKFSIKTTLMLIDQMISLVQALHEYLLIHRDIKPDNFVMGIGDRGNLVHCVDFGLCKQYRDIYTLTHIKYKTQKRIIGTVRYISVNVHEGKEQTRRDDMISITYIMVYFLSGRLPWQGIRAPNSSVKHKKIGEMKKSIGFEELCNHLPKELKSLVKYIHSLSFDEKPDYGYCKCVLRNCMIANNFKYDYAYDWLIKSVGHKHGL